MKYYAQNNPKWASKNIDSVPYTIGRWGCTVSSIANGRLAISGVEMNPKDVSDRLQFTQYGLVKWTSLPALGLQMEKRLLWWDVPEAKKALKDKNKFCLIELNSNHWGLLWSTFPFIRILDPIGAKVRTLKKDKITKTVIIRKLI